MEVLSSVFVISGSLIFAFKFMRDLYNEVSDIQDGISKNRLNNDYLYGFSIGLFIIGVLIYISI
jgi:hypothetical protein